MFNNLVDAAVVAETSESYLMLILLLLLVLYFVWC